MNREQAIEHACQTVALAYHSIGDYSNPSDGFCGSCPNTWSPYYQNSGEALRYVRDAVVAKLKADGHGIGGGFDENTGDDLCLMEAGPKEHVDDRLTSV